MKTKPLRTLQTALGLSGNAVDGRYGPSTHALVQTTLQGINPATTTDWHTWPTERQAVLCLQLLAQRAGFAPGDLDGLWGPQTAFASDQLAHLQTYGEALHPGVPSLCQPIPMAGRWSARTHSPRFTARQAKPT